jgi:hypothetical protein
LGKKCREEQAARAQQQDTSNSANGDSNSNENGSSNSASSVHSTSSAHYITSNKSRILTITLACVAGSAALAAIILGTRRAVRVRHHPLHGVLNQRIRMFHTMNPGTPLNGVSEEVGSMTAYQRAWSLQLVLN